MTVHKFGKTQLGRKCDTCHNTCEVGCFIPFFVSWTKYLTGATWGGSVYSASWFEAAVHLGVGIAARGHTQQRGQGSEKGGCHCSLGFPLSYSVWDPSIWHGAIQSTMGLCLPSSVKSLIFLKRDPDVCLLGDSKSSQVANDSSLGGSFGRGTSSSCDAEWMLEQKSGEGQYGPDTVAELQDHLSVGWPLHFRGGGMVSVIFSRLLKSYTSWEILWRECPDWRQTLPNLRACYSGRE